jgi:hypothetical protein
MKALGQIVSTSGILVFTLTQFNNVLGTIILLMTAAYWGFKLFNQIKHDK